MDCWCFHFCAKELLSVVEWHETQNIWQFLKTNEFGMVFQKIQLSPSKII